MYLYVGSSLAINGSVRWFFTSLIMFTCLVVGRMECDYILACNRAA